MVNPAFVASMQGFVQLSPHHEDVRHDERVRREHEERSQRAEPRLVVGDRRRPDAEENGGDEPAADHDCGPTTGPGALGPLRRRVATSALTRQTSTTSARDNRRTGVSRSARTSCSRSWISSRACSTSVMARKVFQITASEARARRSAPFRSKILQTVSSAAAAAEEDR